MTTIIPETGRTHALWVCDDDHLLYGYAEVKAWYRDDAQGEEIDQWVMRPLILGGGALVPLPPGKMLLRLFPGPVPKEVRERAIDAMRAHILQGRHGEDPAA